MFTFLMCVVSSCNVMFFLKGSEYHETVLYKYSFQGAIISLSQNDLMVQNYGAIGN